MREGVLVIGDGFLYRELKSHYKSLSYDVGSNSDNVFEKINLLMREFGPNSKIVLNSGLDSIKESWEDPIATIQGQLRQTLEILWFLFREKYDGRLLLIGSGDEYGKVSTQITEETPCNPINIYGASKACQTMLGSLFYKSHGLDVMTARVFNEIGPGQGTNFVVSSLCKQVAEIELGIKAPVISVGNILIKRSFTDVKDVISAIDLILESGSSGEVYNVGTENCYTIKQILDLLKTFSNKRIEILFDQNKYRSIDSPIVWPSSSKIYRQLGWKPSVQILKSLRDIYNYWLNQLSS